MLLRDSNSSTIAMFRKLLATRIVAKSFFGLDSRFCTIPSFFAIAFSLFVSKSEGVNEKKATSAPEIRAEQASKTTSKMLLVICEKSKIVKRSKPGGSVSKLMGLIKR